jgi:hypothetical protein
MAIPKPIGVARASGLNSSVKFIRNKARKYSLPEVNVRNWGEDQSHTYKI